MASIPPSDMGLAGQATEGPSPFARMISALMLSPRAFQRPIRAADWLVPALIAMAVVLIGSFAIHDLALQKATEQRSIQIAKIDANDQLSADQKASGRKQIEFMTSEKMVRVFEAGKPLIVPLSSLFAALLFLLAVNFVMGGKTSYRDLWFIGCLGWSPRIIESVLVTAVAKLTSNAEAVMGPAAFFPNDSRAFRVLSVFSIFDIWVIAVMAVGVHALGGLSKGKALGVTIGLWVLRWLILGGMVAISPR
jgi:hypothetical protein